MNIVQAVLLGIVEGVTEFLPVSSTGHLTIVEQLVGLDADSTGVTAFTAIIQVGAIAAVIVYFHRDILTLATAWIGGLRHRDQRDDRYRLAWWVILGSVPIGVVGFLARNLVSGGLRNLWVVVIALVLWSVPMVLSERLGRQHKDQAQVTAGDAVVIGLVQCLALIPGVSRSGATITAGLFRGLDRVAATRISFYLSIPALLAAGGYETVTQFDTIGTSVGWGPTAIGTAVSFLVALASIAWLLRLVAQHPITVFVWYRLGAAFIVALLIGTGTVTAT